jgi:hypothetical protein
MVPNSEDEQAAEDEQDANSISKTEVSLFEVILIYGLFCSSV